MSGHSSNVCIMVHYLPGFTRTWLGAFERGMLLSFRIASKVGVEIPVVAMATDNRQP